MQAFWSRTSVVWDGAAGTFSQAVGLARALDARRMPTVVRGPVSKGWRRRLFGEDALRLKRGEVALTLNGGEVVTTEVSKS